MANACYFSKAIARFRRAVELAADSPNAHRGLAIAFCELAAEGKLNTAYKSSLLNEAEKETRIVLALAGEDYRPYHDLGWIYDERGNYAEAIENYRKALELAEHVGDTEPNLRYNLACSLSKDGRFGEALTELEKIIGVDGNWEDVLIDPDLESLRADAGFGPKLVDLAKDGRRRATGEPS